jgi:hypothetical protein
MTNVLDDIRASLGQMVTLKIRTEVGAAKMETSINLLQGDITTKIDPEFITGAYQSLRDFHAAREAEAANIVKNNIEALHRLVELALKVGLDTNPDTSKPTMVAPSPTRAG